MIVKDGMFCFLCFDAWEDSNLPFPLTRRIDRICYMARVSASFFETNHDSDDFGLVHDFSKKLGAVFAPFVLSDLSVL